MLAGGSPRRSAQVSELGKRIASDLSFSVDDYVLHLVRKFYLPWPAFDGYRPATFRVFPLAASAKWLLANWGPRTVPCLSPEEALGYLAANSVDGTEDLGVYRGLVRQPYSAGHDEVRQTREMLQFLSQLTVLRWGPGLCLELAGDELLVNKLPDALRPEAASQLDDPDEELLSLGRFEGSLSIGLPTVQDEAEQGFFEGRPVARSHVRLERSRSPAASLLPASPASSM